MPRIQLELAQDLDAGSVARLTEGLRDAARSLTGARVDAISVTVDAGRAAPPSSAARSSEPRQAEAEAMATVRAYLAAMEARDLGAARGHLAAGFRMIFPGGASFGSLEDMVAWAAPRYRFVTRTYAAWDASVSDRETVVHCNGTLAGAWPDGTPFDGIRFIDRFDLTDGLIARQEVWNDLGEARRTAGAEATTA